MSRKIIGVTVGTPISTSKIDEKLKPVKTVNGITPDESGNVELPVSEGTVKSVNGVKPDEQGNVEITIPDSGGNVDFRTDETLTLKDGVLSVNTTDSMEQDNTLPITSAGVFATVGNIEALLKTI